MTGFFGLLSFLTSAALLTSIVLGLIGNGYHLMLAVFSAVVAVSLHCLVFGIFTGAGKDTRELAEDLSLSQEYFQKIKRFRKTCFPQALYAILVLMGAIFLGGAVTVSPSFFLGLVHGLFASVAVLYNIKVFRLEFCSIRENASILAEVNRVAASAVQPKGRKLEPGLDLEPVSPVEWGTHVFALGRFLCFLSMNMMLPYLYTRFIMGILTMPFWPYLLASVFLLLAGYYLRYQYREFEPMKMLQH